MKKINLLNLSRVQKAVTGTDGKTYYLPSRKPTSLPAGVEVLEGLSQEIKVTVKES